MERWKIVKTRWNGTNRGDGANPDIRSRLVGKQFNNSDKEVLFAATPPLEALRMLISDVATRKAAGKIIMINDVARPWCTERCLCYE